MRYVILPHQYSWCYIEIQAWRNNGRVLTNVAVERVLQKEAELGASLQFEDIVEEVAGLNPKVMIEGKTESSIWSCGMVAGLINDIPSCQDLLDRIILGAKSVIQQRVSQLCTKD